VNQFLSQDEVDALLRGISDGEVETEQDNTIREHGIQLYDLTNQERIIRGRMPTLEIVNQKMARQLRAALSGTLRRVVDVNALNVQMIKFGEFLKTLPVPTSMHVIRLLPLRGGALLVLESKLVFALIDSFFGGPGSTHVKVEGRDFTPIESHMILRVAEIIFEEMESAWEPIESIRIELERSEVNPQFVGIVPPSEVVVITPFEVEMDDARGIITVCIPYSTIEPIRAKLYAGFQSERLEMDQGWLRRLLRQLEGLEVETSVEIGNTEISLGTLLNLQVGDIIRLDQDTDDELLIKVEGMPKFKGFARRIRQKKAVEITSRLRSPEEEEQEEEEQVEQVEEEKEEKPYE
jgi:flagellar motor switch protein FliM